MQGPNLVRLRPKLKGYKPHRTGHSETQGISVPEPIQTLHASALNPRSGAVDTSQSAYSELRIDPCQGHNYITDMITFAQILRLRLPVVPTAGSFVVFAK